jgi:cellulase/cellobiase CelA1
MTFSMLGMQNFQEYKLNAKNQYISEITSITSIPKYKPYILEQRWYHSIMLIELQLLKFF